MGRPINRNKSNTRIIFTVYTKSVNFSPFSGALKDQQMETQKMDLINLKILLRSLFGKFDEDGEGIQLINRDNFSLLQDYKFSLDNICSCRV